MCNDKWVETERKLATTIADITANEDSGLYITFIINQYHAKVQDRNYEDKYRKYFCVVFIASNIVDVIWKKVYQTPTKNQEPYITCNSYHNNQ